MNTTAVNIVWRSVPIAVKENFLNILVITVLSFVCSYSYKLLPILEKQTGLQRPKIQTETMDGASHGFLLGFFLHELKHSVSECAPYYSTFLLDFMHKWTPEDFVSTIEATDPSSIPVIFEAHRYELIKNESNTSQTPPMKYNESNHGLSYYILKILSKIFIGIMLFIGSYFKFFVMLYEAAIDDKILTSLFIGMGSAMLAFKGSKNYIVFITSVAGLLQGKYQYFWATFIILYILKMIFPDEHSHSHSVEHEQHSHSHSVEHEQHSHSHSTVHEHSHHSDHSHHAESELKKDTSPISVVIKLFPFFCDSVAEGIVLIKERDHAMDRFTALVSLAIHKILEAGTIVGQTISRSEISDASKLIICCIYSLTVPLSSIIFSYLDKLYTSIDGSVIVPQIVLSTLFHIVLFEVLPELPHAGKLIIWSAVGMLTVIDAMELIFGGAH